MALDLNLWPIKADPTQFEEILGSLAANARDAMPRGGRLRIRATNLTKAECKGNAEDVASAADQICNLPRFISIDPGVDEGERRSFSVVLLWATDGVTHYLIDRVRKRCHFRDFLRMTKSVIRDNIGAPILIEHMANGPALLSALSERHGVRMPSRRAIRRPRVSEGTMKNS